MPNRYGKERPSKANKPKAALSMLGGGMAKKAGNILKTRRAKLAAAIKKAGG